MTTGIDFFDEKAETAPGTSGRETRYNRSLFAQARQDLTDRMSVSYGALYDHQWSEGADGSAFENDATDLPGHEVLNPCTSDTPRSLDNPELRLDLRHVFDRTCASRSSDGLGHRLRSAVDQAGPDLPRDHENALLTAVSAPAKRRERTARPAPFSHHPSRDARRGRIRRRSRPCPRTPRDGRNA